MIGSTLYQDYFSSLMDGDKKHCLEIVKSLLGDGILIQDLYTHLFQKSLYQVGELWELNKISVAREHLATAITESMLSAVYPYLFSGKHSDNTAVISCTANEFHQLGGKMVADILEVQGWDSHFLGANTPVGELLRFVDKVQPDLLGFSLAVYFNLQSLKNALDSVRGNFKDLDIIVGGHAFVWGGTGLLKEYPRVEYVDSLARLEESI